MIEMEKLTQEHRYLALLTTCLERLTALPTGRKDADLRTVEECIDAKARLIEDLLASPAIAHYPGLLGRLDSEDNSRISQKRQVIYRKQLQYLIQGCLEAPPLAGQPLAAVHEQLLALVCEGYFMGYQSSAAIWRIYRDFFDSLAKLKKSYDKTSSDGSVFSLFLTKLVALYERLKAYIHAHVMKQPPVVQDKDLTRLWAAETRLQESALLQHFHQLSQERKTIQSCQGEDIPNRLKAIDDDLNSLSQKLKVLLAPASYVHQTTEQIGILEDTLLQGVELIQHLEQQFNDVKNEIETFNNTQKKTHSTTAPPPPEQQEKRVALVLSERAKNYCLQLNIDITQPVYTQTITKKYRELAKQYHPDKNQEAPEEAHQQFQAMKSIYDKLCREIKGEQNPDFAQEVADLQRDVDLFCKKSRELKQQLEEQNRIIDQQISALKAESQQNEATLKAQGAEIEAVGAEIKAQGARIEAQGARIEAQGARIKAQGAEIKAQGAEIKARGARIEAQSAEIKAQGAEIKTQGARIDFLIKMMEEMREQVKGKEKDDTPSTGPGFFN